MKFYVLILLTLFSVSVSAQKKPKKLAPFQSNINECFEEQLDLKNIKDAKTLYLEIVKAYTLQASETGYREVIFEQGGEKRKLVYEDGVIQISRFDAEGKVSLVSTEKLSQGAENTGMRYKINSLEAKIQQQLNRASIKSDYIKTTEYRAKQIVLNLVWVDSGIKNLSVQFGPESGDTKRQLECQKKETADICECKH
ncbi:MAG: hypothetical protein ACXVBD_06200 [Pseudobdellovibrio sp.]